MSEEEAQHVSVLKDLNFKGRIFFDAEDRPLFLKQVKLDCDLLIRCSIMDYSLLLGIHQPDDAEDSGNDGEQKAGDDAGTPKMSKALAHSDNSGYLSRWMQSSGGIEGRTPLWNKEVYFLSIIDILQLYDLSKRAEHVVKGLKYSTKEISSVNGKQYAERFIEYIESVTVGIDGVNAYRAEQERIERDKGLALIAERDAAQRSEQEGVELERVERAASAEKIREDAEKELEQEAWLAAWRKGREEIKEREVRIFHRNAFPTGKLHSLSLSFLSLSVECVIACSCLICRFDCTMVLPYLLTYALCSLPPHNAPPVKS